MENVQHPHWPDSSTSSPAPEPVRRAAPPASIRCDIIFGSPKDDCRGSGICRIDVNGAIPGASGARTDCSRAKARLTSPDRHTLVFDIRREDLCAELYRDVFRKDHLVLEAPCPLPAVLIEGFHLAGEALRIGTYAVEEEKTGFRLSLSVS